MRIFKQNEFRWNCGRYIRQTIGSHLIGMSINKSTHNRFVIDSFQFSSVQFSLVRFAFEQRLTPNERKIYFKTTKNCNDSQIWTQLTHLRVRLLWDSSQFCLSFFCFVLAYILSICFFRRWIAIVQAYFHHECVSIAVLILFLKLQPTTMRTSAAARNFFCLFSVVISLCLFWCSQFAYIQTVKCSLTQRKEIERP